MNAAGKARQKWKEQQQQNLPNLGTAFKPSHVFYLTRNRKQAGCVQAEWYLPADEIGFSEVRE